jgi:hypothetical protein
MNMDRSLLTKVCVCLFAANCVLYFGGAVWEITVPAFDSQWYKGGSVMGSGKAASQATVELQIGNSTFSVIHQEGLTTASSGIPPINQGYYTKDLHPRPEAPYNGQWPTGASLYYALLNDDNFEDVHQIQIGEAP